MTITSKRNKKAIDCFFIPFVALPAKDYFIPTHDVLFNHVVISNELAGA
jgi:hypothetical protein